MSESVVSAAVEVDPATVGIQRTPVTHRRAHRMFYGGMSGTLLLIVLIGFAPTLYLRPFFDVPEYPAYLLAHGVVLTAWYVGFFFQTVLVAAHRTGIHRRLGWAVAGLAVAVLAVNVMVLLALVPRRGDLGIDRLSFIVWADSAALLSFSIFVSTAIAFRHRPETHKRLMLLASISMIGPALTRIWRWPVFAGIDIYLLGTGALFLLLLALALFDLISSKRLHPVTLVGGSFFFISMLFAVFVICTSEFGRSWARIASIRMTGDCSVMAINGPRRTA